MTCLEGIIQENHPKLQEQFEAFKKATTLAKMMLIAFRIGCFLAIIVVEKELAERANRPCQRKWACLLVAEWLNLLVNGLFNKDLNVQVCDGAKMALTIYYIFALHG